MHLCKSGVFHYFAVVDGVSSWRDDNIDPVEFTASLMQEIKKLVEKLSEEEEVQMSCHDMIQGAYAILRAEHENGKKHYGSCTFCLAKVNLSNGEIEIANIGDSAIAVLRVLKFILQTKISQKGWCSPFRNAWIKPLPRLQIGHSNQIKLILN